MLYWIDFPTKILLLHTNQYQKCVKSKVIKAINATHPS